ncbi:DUF6082 family protein [Streptomyces melanogenes]|uniref:DUF6082 family protein n=1 Tax=Streptomyces melanogenes TaxID=67326 RepID=UPI003791B491
MKLLTLAALSAVATSAAHVALAHKRHQDHARMHRERAALTTGLLHQRWLARGIENPELLVAWPDFAEMSESERALNLHINSAVTLWWLQYSTGVTTGDQVAHMARSLMRTEHGRRYWERAGAYRSEEDGGRDQIREFNELISSAYSEAMRAANNAPAAA